MGAQEILHDLSELIELYKQILSLMFHPSAALAEPLLQQAGPYYGKHNPTGMCLMSSLGIALIRNLVPSRTDASQSVDVQRPAVDIVYWPQLGPQSQDEIWRFAKPAAWSGPGQSTDMSNFTLSSLNVTEFGEQEGPPRRGGQVVFWDAEREFGFIR